MIGTVLAALDASAAARPVLEAAIQVAQLMDATVEAVHARDGPSDTPEWLAARHDVSLRLLHGPVAPALIEAVAGDPVVAAVIGARSTPHGRRPVGRTAMTLLERATKPVVVVTPDALVVPGAPMRRLLLPLDGDVESSRPLAQLESLCNRDVELIVLHVFTKATLPRTLDRTQRDLSLWGEEFVARHCPGAAQVELRTGEVGRQVAETCAHEAVDLIVLSWSRDSSPGHAAVVRDVLGNASVPVLLLPVDQPL